MVRDAPDTKKEMRECIFNKGQSKRLWNELYKVCKLHIRRKVRILALRNNPRIAQTNLVCRAEPASFATRGSPPCFP